MSVRELPLAEIYPSGPEADAPGATAHPGENTRALALLLGAALALMLVWTAVVPFDKGPDEAEHYRVAHFIYANGRLPVFAADGDMYGYVVNAEEAFISYAALPGFNYVLSALAMRLVLTDDPYALLYAARFVSTLAVLATIYLAYRTARLLFPERPNVARGTALLLVLIPQVTLTGAYVNQDAYTMAVCSWTIYLLLAGWKQGWTAGRAAWLGVALGLVLLGRLNGYVVIPFAFLVAALSLRGGVGFVLLRMFITGSVATLVSGWWFVRSYAQTGDPIGIQAVFEAWRALAPLRQAPREIGVSFLDILRGDTPYLVFRTFWGAFGQLEVYFLWPYYALLGLLTLGAGAGLAWGLVQWFAGPRPLHVLFDREYARSQAFLAAAVALLGVLVLGMVALVFWQAWATSFATQGRYLFPAVVPIVLFIALGITALPLGRVLQPLALGCATAFLFVLNLIGLFAYTVPTYYL